MAVLNTDRTIERIKAATENSKIAVFHLGSNHKFLTLFDNTVQTQNRIEKKEPDYIDSYFGKNGAKFFERLLLTKCI
jgi:hypothetical protein